MLRVLLSSFLLAGAAIGSGILALPILAAAPGFVNTIIFIGLTFICSLVIAKPSLYMYATYTNHDVNAATLAKDYFGEKGYWTSIILNVLSMGGCTAAYITVGGEILTKVILPKIHIIAGPTTGIIIFILIFAPFFVAGIKYISRINGLIFLTKYLCLFIVISLGLKFINPSRLEFVPQGLIYLGSGASTMMAIWVMHMTLPVVLKLNDWNPKKAFLAVKLGLGIAAILYVGWLVVILSLISRPQFLQLKTIGDILQYLVDYAHISPLMQILIAIFSSITVLTSFLSIGFSLIEFLIDVMSLKDNIVSRFIAMLIAFIIPVSIAVIFSKQFVKIYQQSNIFSIGSALIPAIVVLVYNRQKQQKNSKALIMAIIAGLLIILSQILNDFGIFPNFIN
jgi:tyrosine-specific transport protein